MERVFSNHLLPSIWGSFLCHSRRFYRAEKWPFSIPDPIQRSPTDLLKALAGTVKDDPSTPHYSLIDDPATIPTHRNQMEKNILSREMGRRAARKLVQEWPTLFMFDRDNPVLEVFRPEKPLNPKVIEPTEENLQKLMDKKHVENAIILFKRIKEEENTISEKTQLDLFNLICYYNGKNPPLSEVEEWHGMRNIYQRFDESKFQSIEENYAMALFENLPKTAETYSVLISGLLKFETPGSIKQAQKFYHEMIEQKLIPYEEVFNSMLRAHVSLEDKAKFDPFEWLKQMSELGVLPSIRTYNACLKAVKTKDQAHIILSYMANQGIEENLTTYSHMLELYCEQAKKRKEALKPLANLLGEILDKLEVSKEIKFSETDDKLFFPKALESAILLDNEQLANRIQMLYESGKNRVKMINLIDETQFYRDLLFYKYDILGIDEFTKLYISFVPSRICLTGPLLEDLFTKIYYANYWPLIRRLTQDIISSEMLYSWQVTKFIRDKLLKMELDSATEKEVEEYKTLATELIDAYYEIGRLTASKPTKIRKDGKPERSFRWTNRILLECVILMLKIDKKDKAFSLFNMLVGQKLNDYGEPVVAPGVMPLYLLHDFNDRMPKEWEEKIDRTKWKALLEENKEALGHFQSRPRREPHREYYRKSGTHRRI